MKEEPIEQKYRAMMRDLAESFDSLVNEPGKPKTTGFAIFIFDFDDTKRVNYISNANRVDMIAAMKEWLARAEGRVADGGEGKH